MLAYLKFLAWGLMAGLQGCASLGGVIQSMSWLPKVEALGYPRHPTSTKRYFLNPIKQMHKIILNNNKTCSKTVGLVSLLNLINHSSYVNIAILILKNLL